jgi:hypothetical protein
MYNLDVYCGKYDSYIILNFSTGDIDKNIENLLNILKPVKKDSKILKTNNSVVNINKDEELII